MRLYTGQPARDTEPRGLVSALAPCLTRRVADRCPPRRLASYLNDARSVWCRGCCLTCGWRTGSGGVDSLGSRPSGVLQTIEACLFGLVLVLELIAPGVV